MEDNKTQDNLELSGETSDDTVEIKNDEMLKLPDGEYHDFLGHEHSHHHSHSSHSSHGSHHSHSHHSHHHSSHSHHSHRSHQSSHSSHRRSSRRRDSSKNNNKFIEFIKSHKSAIVNTSICVVIFVLLLLLAGKNDGRPTQGSSSSGTITENTRSTIKIESSVFSDELLLAHVAVDEYINGTEDGAASAIDVWNKHKVNGNRIDIAYPVRYTYRINGLPSDVTLKKAKLELAKDKSYSKAEKYDLDITKDSVALYNLIPDTHYFYRLTLTLSNGKTVGTTGDFITADLPRILYVEGAVNVRDFGGWSVEGGKTIPYGLLLRGSELDGVVESTYKINDEGKEVLLSDFGIRFDMDLRSPTVNPEQINALGRYVKHVYYDLGMYTEIFNDSRKDGIRRVFSDLANPSNYPIYLHCTYGRDRTGTVCYILGALLGMSPADLQRDYELSVFASGYINVAGYASLTTRLGMFEGRTLSEKAENYLLSVGVTAEEIASIKTIFLGE